MPWYRMRGFTVHIRMAGKAPAPCVARIQNPAGGTMRCMGISTALCDHRLEDGSTCDAPLCVEHASEIGPDRHLCPLHRSASPPEQHQPPLL